MKRAALALLACVAATTACGSRKRQQRTSDAAPVEAILAPAPGDANAVRAGAADEVEPNDTQDTAMELVPGSSIHGRIAPVDTDLDSFAIDIAEAGVLALDLGAVAQTDLMLELHDAGGGVVARSDRLLPNLKEGLPNFAVTKGRYTVVVKGRKVLIKGKPANAAPPILPYDLAAQLVKPGANVEREPNDDRGTANDLIVGDGVTGWIGWTADADVWKLSIEALSARNTLDVEIGAVEAVALTFELADAVGQPLLVRKGPRGGGLNVRGLRLNVPDGAPPFHYLIVKGAPSNPDIAYSLRAVPNNLEIDAEVEPNDTIEQALAFPEERTVVNAQWSPGDTDCFAIAPAPDERTLEVAVDVSGEVDLSAELVVDGKVVAKAEAKGRGIAERLAGQVPRHAGAIICVHGTETGSEGRYEVRVSEGAGK